VNDNPDTLIQLLTLLSTLANTLGQLLLMLGRALLAHVLIIAWVAWWLFGVNWSKTWPVLARGAWVPVLLLVIVIAMVWSKLAPREEANFWYQLAELSVLVAIALFCGWLQGVLGWTPAEINLEPPAAGAHEHGHHH
jgi:hypothetical protein